MPNMSTALYQQQQSSDSNHHSAGPSQSHTPANTTAQKRTFKSASVDFPIRTTTANNNTFLSSLVHDYVWSPMISHLANTTSLLHCQAEQKMYSHVPESVVLQKDRQRKQERRRKNRRRRNRKKVRSSSESEDSVSIRSSDGSSADEVRPRKSPKCSAAAVCKQALKFFDYEVDDEDDDLIAFEDHHDSGSTVRRNSKSSCKAPKSFLFCDDSDEDKTENDEDDSDEWDEIDESDQSSSDDYTELLVMMGLDDCGMNLKNIRNSSVTLICDNASQSPVELYLTEDDIRRNLAAAQADAECRKAVKDANKRWAETRRKWKEEMGPAKPVVATTDDDQIFDLEVDEEEDQPDCAIMMNHSSRHLVPSKSAKTTTTVGPRRVRFSAAEPEVYEIPEKDECRNKEHWELITRDRLRIEDTISKILQPEHRVRMAGLIEQMEKSYNKSQQ